MQSITSIYQQPGESNGTRSHELQNNTADSRYQAPVSQFSGEDVTVSVTVTNIVEKQLGCAEEHQ